MSGYLETLASYLPVLITRRLSAIHRCSPNDGRPFLAGLFADISDSRR